MGGGKTRGDEGAKKLRWRIGGRVHIYTNLGRVHGGVWNRFDEEHMVLALPRVFMVRGRRSDVPEWFFLADRENRM